MSGGRQWVVAAIAGVAVAIGALLGAAALFSAYLYEATRIAPFETPDGILVASPSPFAPTLSYALTAAVLAVLASIVLPLVAIGVARVRPHATAPARVAVSIGPLAVLALQLGGSVFGYWQDPPEAHVGTILGVLPQEVLALAAVYILPVALAWFALSVWQRKRVRTDAPAASA